MIDVPLVPPQEKVVLRGQLKLEVVYEADAIRGRPYNEIRQQVLEVLTGSTGWWYPGVVLGDLSLWRVDHDGRLGTAADPGDPPGGAEAPGASGVPPHGY